MFPGDSWWAAQQLCLDLPLLVLPSMPPATACLQAANLDYSWRTKPGGYLQKILTSRVYHVAVGWVGVGFGGGEGIFRDCLGTSLAAMRGAHGASMPVLTWARPRRSRGVRLQEETPLQEAVQLSEALGGKLYLKREDFQV